MFCPGEPIIVNCLVMNILLLWSIRESSLVIQRKKIYYLTFNVLDPSVDPYRFLNSSAGRLNFYRNETYAGSSKDNSQSFIDSELHMQLNHVNDFIDVRCTDIFKNLFTTINITTFPGMLNIARKKIFVIVSLYYYIYSSLHFSLSEVLPPPITINLRTTSHREYATMSYHMLKWTINNQANVTHFILRVLNFTVLEHYSKNVSIPGDMNSYYFHRHIRDSLSLSIVAINRCNMISGMSNNVELPSNFSCK